MPDDVTALPDTNPANDTLDDNLDNMPLPDTAPADDSATGQQQDAKDTQAEDDEMSIFRFTEDAATEQEGEQQAEEGEGQKDGEQDEAQADAVPEGWALSDDCDIPAEMHEGLGKLAAKHKLAGADAAAFIQEAMAYAKAEERAANMEILATMKKNWGSQFAARVKATQAYMAKFAVAAGIPIKAMEPFMSPYGIMFFDQVRSHSGEAGKLPGNMGAPVATQSARQRLDQIYGDPELYEALVNPSNKRFEEVNAEVDRLQAIVDGAGHR